SEFLLTQVNLEAVSATNATAFVSNGANPRVSEVFARVASEQGSSVGYQMIGGAPVISEAFALIESAAGNGTGFDVLDNAFPTLLEIRALVLGVNRTGTGLASNNSRPQVQNCNLVIGGQFGGQGSRGIFLTRESNATIKDCVVNAVGAFQAAGLWVERDSEAKVNESTFAGIANTGYGLINRAGTTQVDRGTLEGSTRSVINLGGGDVALIGASRLVGPVQAALGSTLSCAQSYNGVNAPVNPACL
ncbi:MAG: hypothetical protein AAGN66_19855, partial [Acidobacteriota bacterium]